MKTTIGLLLGVLALPAFAGDLAATADRFPDWLTALLGFLGGAATTLVSVWGARRARLGELDQAVHERRLDLYPRLVACASRLAVYFPRAATDNQPLSPQDCAEMGRSMSRWYFGGGGLLLSEQARDAYFNLMRALTLASLEKTLRVPMLPDDARLLSVGSVDEYRRRIVNLHDVENWKFGGAAAPHDPPEVRFGDYVFLQRLSSEVRSALAGDIRGRRRPA